MTQSLNSPVAAPALLNSWANYAGSAAAGYWKDPNGLVRVRGTVSGGTTATAVFTLGPGFIPASTEEFPGLCFAGGVYTICQLAVFTTGAVTYNGPASPTWVTLASVAFLAGV